jgi:hypothetical protein
MLSESLSLHYFKSIGCNANGCSKWDGRKNMFQGVRENGIHMTVSFQNWLKTILNLKVDLAGLTISLTQCRS